MRRVANSLRRFTTISSALDTLRNSRIAFLNPDTWDDKNDAEFIRLYRTAKANPNLKALCCTESPESYHLWKVFTNATDRCFIDIVKIPLLRKIKSNDDYFYAEIEYKTLVQMGNGNFEVADLPFLKRAGFQDEAEFRIIYVGECVDNAHFLPIEAAWIRRIVLNPWLSKPLAESVTKTFREVSGNPKLRVTASKLINSASWTDHGKRIVKRDKLSS